MLTYDHNRKRGSARKTKRVKAGSVSVKSEGKGAKRKTKSVEGRGKGVKREKTSDRVIYDLTASSCPELSDVVDTDLRTDLSTGMYELSHYSVDTRHHIRSILSQIEPKHYDLMARIMGGMSRSSGDREASLNVSHGDDIYRDGHARVSLFVCN